MFAGSASTASMHAVRRRDREAASDYVSRHPTETVLYALVRDHLESFLDHARQNYARGLPHYVEQAFRGYLTCGVFAHGFLRLHCDHCRRDLLVAFSCQGRVCQVVYPGVPGPSGHRELAAPWRVAVPPHGDETSTTRGAGRKRRAPTTSTEGSRCGSASVGSLPRDAGSATRRAFVYNVVGVPIAAGALYPFTGWLLSPVIVSAAMSLSSVSVLTSLLR